MLMNEEMLKYIIYAIECEDNSTCITLCHEVIVTQRAQYSDLTDQVEMAIKEAELTLNNDRELTFLQKEENKQERESFS